MMAEVEKKEGLAEKFLCRVLHNFIFQKPTLPPPTGNLDWNRIDELIFHYNLMPIFDFTVETSALTPERIKRWHPSRIVVLHKNVQILKISADLFSILEKNNIAAVALRGLNLAHFFYPDPGLRPMRDVDILINPHDCNKLQTVLRSLKYLPTRILRSQLVYVIKGIIFEIHGSFLTTKRYRSTIDSASLIRSRIRRQTPQGPIFCLPQEQELISVVAHAFIHHELDRLLPLVDIGLLMTNPGLNWDFIIKWCRQNRLTKLFLFTLSFANYLLMLNRETQLLNFKHVLPSSIIHTFEAYADRIWGSYTARSRLLRMKTMLYVAEHPFTKFRQFLRMLGLRNFRMYARLLIKGKLSRRGGMDPGFGDYGNGESGIISKL